jgi:outer membrane lipoprotein-sorting protein
MISGASGLTRLALALLAAALCAAGALAAEPPAAGAWDLQRLMQALSQVKSSRARFVEVRHLAILNKPLESSGTLNWTAPGKLEKHTLAPRAESLLLDGDRIVLENKALNQRRAFALQQYPEIGVFVESMRSTLAGDLATLQRYYEVGFEGAERQWRLMLKPTDPAMQRLVSEIRIGGAGNQIETIEITETGGDRSVMTITPERP